MLAMDLISMSMKLVGLILVLLVLVWSMRNLAPLRSAKMTLLHDLIGLLLTLLNCIFLVVILRLILALLPCLLNSEKLQLDLKQCMDPSPSIQVKDITKYALGLNKLN